MNNNIPSTRIENLASNKVITVRRINGAVFDESVHSVNHNGAGEANAGFGILQDKVRNGIGIGNKGTEEAHIIAKRDGGQPGAADTDAISWAGSSVARRSYAAEIGEAFIDCCSIGVTPRLACNRDAEGRNLLGEKILINQSSRFTLVAKVKASWE